MKKFISLLLVFSILALSGNLYAQKRGAVLRITDLNGQVIEGELLAIKQDSLLLMTTVSQDGVTVEIDDIRSIEVKRDSRESRFWTGIIPRALVTGSVGFGLGYLVSGLDDGDQLEGGYRCGYVFVVSGTLLGGLLAAIPGGYKTIQFREKSPSKIEKILKKLNKKARFKKEIPQTIEPILIPAKISRIHFTVDHGYFNSQAFNFDGVFGTIGLGGDEALSGPYGRMRSDQFPYFKNFKIEYSINRKFAIGFTFSPLRELESRGGVTARVLVEDPSWWQNEYENYGCDLEGNHRGNLYYLTAAYMPLPEAFHKNSAFKVGVGVGLSAVSLNFRTTTGGYPETEFDSISFSKESLCFSAFGEYNFYYTRNLSIGVNAEYKYIPVKIDAFQLFASYGYADKQFYSSILDFPERSQNFGGFGIGISLGLHF